MNHWHYRVEDEFWRRTEWVVRFYCGIITLGVIKISCILKIFLWFGVWANSQNWPKMQISIQYSRRSIIDGTDLVDVLELYLQYLLKDITQSAVSSLIKKFHLLLLYKFWTSNVNNSLHTHCAPDFIYVLERHFKYLSIQCIRFALSALIKKFFFFGCCCCSLKIFKRELQPLCIFFNIFVSCRLKIILLGLKQVVILFCSCHIKEVDFCMSTKMTNFSRTMCYFDH